MKLRFIPVILAALLLAARFLRSCSLLAPCLLFIKRRWSRVALQLLTIPAAAIWLFTLNGIIQQWISEQVSRTIFAIILGVVMGFTLLAGLLLNSRKVKERYS